MSDEGYTLLAIGKKYVKECEYFVNTLRKQGDFRPVSIVVNDKNDVEIDNFFDKIIPFEIFDDKLWNDCKTSFEKYCLYPRLFLNKYAQYKKNITIDSDMLCNSSTEKVWKFLNGNKLSQLGLKNDETWHWGYINEVSEAYGKTVPHVHGGFFYFEKDDPFVEEYFDYVKEVFIKYDDYKCKSMYDGGKTDEILFAIAHAKYDLLPIDFDEFPIMTFNSEIIPSSMETKIGNKLATFIHCFSYKPGTEKFEEQYKKILNVYFTEI